MLLLAQLLKKDAPAYKSMPTDLAGKANYAKDIWDSLIKPHLLLEENVLFPTVLNNAPSLSNLVTDLRKEHKEIMAIFNKLTHDIETLDGLGNLIEQHVRKEERIFFQEVQELLSDEQLSQLRTLLSAS